MIYRKPLKFEDWRCDSLSSNVNKATEVWNQSEIPKCRHMNNWITSCLENTEEETFRKKKEKREKIRFYFLWQHLKKNVQRIIDISTNPQMFFKTKILNFIVGLPWLAARCPHNHFLTSSPQQDGGENKMKNPTDWDEDKIIHLLPSQPTQILLEEV